MKNNYTFPTIILGNSLILIGCGMYSITPLTLSVPNLLYASQVVTGFGAGLTFCCTTMIISLNASFKDHALGQGLIAQARVLGGTLGVAASNALFGNKIGGLGDVLSSEQISILYRNPGYISQLNVMQQVAVREAFGLAFNECLRVCTYVAAVSWLVSLFVWQRDPPSLQQRKEELDAAMREGAVPEAFEVERYSRPYKV